MTGYQAYRGNQIEGAGPLGLVILTYDALNKYLGYAKQGIESKELAEEATHTARALEALLELSTSLDMEQGGEVAVNLARLYSYMSGRLTDEMCSESAEAVDEVMILAATLREGWKTLQIEQQQIEQQQSARSAASRPVAAYGAAPSMAAYAG